MTNKFSNRMQNLQQLILRIMDISFRYQKDFLVINKYAKNLMALNLPLRIKLYLTWFSNLARNGGASEKETKRVDSLGDKSELRFNCLPWRPIPNIRGFKIKLRTYDWLFAAFGMESYFKPEMEFEKYKNHKLNRYLWWSQRVLRNKIRQKDYKGFWNFAEFLISRSKVYFLCQLQDTYLNWHRDLPYNKVKSASREYFRIGRMKRIDIDLKRVFIPKTKEKMRPLGVPGLAWRLYFGTVNKFLWLGIKEFIPEEQHGFQPFKGTMTAWRSWFLKFYDKRNIYEFDLTQFFDTIDLTKLIEWIHVEYKIPFKILGQIWLTNMCTPAGWVLTHGDQTLGDIPARVRELVGKMIREGTLHKTDFGRILGRSDINTSSMICPADGEIGKNALGMVNGSFHKFSKIFPDTIVKIKGVAQGLPTSPLLAQCILDKLVFRRFPGKVSMYADDGYIAFDEDSLIPEIENLKMLGDGVFLNKSKSGWVKQRGQWLKPFKFLGLEYDGIQGILRAHTREGSRLVYDKVLLVEYVRERLLLSETSPKKRKYKGVFEDLVESTIYGLIQARLYSGSYTTEKLEQDFRLTFLSGSWTGNQESRKDLTVFTSTSFALHSLGNYLRGKKFNKTHGYDPLKLPTIKVPDDKTFLMKKLDMGVLWISRKKRAEFDRIMRLVGELDRNTLYKETTLGIYYDTSYLWISEKGYRTWLNRLKRESKA